MAFRPFQDRDLSLNALQDEINGVFDRIWHSGLRAGPFDGQQWAPPVDLFEHPEHYTLFVELPGIDAASVEVTHVGSTLTICGEKTRPAGIGESDKALRSERRFGTFSRSLELPGDVEADRLSAKCHAGVLEITIPKSDANRPKSVKIDVQEG